MCKLIKFLFRICWNNFLFSLIYYINYLPLIIAFSDIWKIPFLALVCLLFLYNISPGVTYYAFICNLFGKLYLHNSYASHMSGFSI